MKNFSKLVIILFISLFLVSCGTNKSDSTLSTEGTTKTTFNQASSTATQVTTTTTASPATSTVKEATIISKASVTITSFYEEPKSAKDKDTMIIGEESNSEYVEIRIQGKIKDFELINMEWDDTKNDVVEKESTNQIKELENKTIVLKTILAETIPSQKIKWKSEAGKVYEYVIVDDGVDSKNNAVKVFDME